jgi:hypothetical protein
MALTIFRALPQPTRSLGRIVFKGQEGPEGSKGTLMPDFKAKTWPRPFYKKAMSPQETGRRFEGNPGIVILRQF